MDTKFDSAFYLQDIWHKEQSIFLEHKYKKILDSEKKCFFFFTKVIFWLFENFIQCNLIIFTFPPPIPHLSILSTLTSLTIELKVFFYPMESNLSCSTVMGMVPAMDSDKNIRCHTNDKRMPILLCKTTIKC